MCLRSRRTATGIMPGVEAGVFGATLETGHMFGFCFADGISLGTYSRETNQEDQYQPCAHRSEETNGYRELGHQQESWDNPTSDESGNTSQMGKSKLPLR